MSREDEIREIQMEMRREFSRMYAEAVERGEVKKPDWKDFIVGYRLDDNGSPVN